MTEATAIETEPTTALAILPATALPTILAADTTDILGRLAARVGAFAPDPTTPAGRDAMRSLAYEIAKSKTALVRIGKGLTEDWREQTKAVNTECRTIETRLDALRDQVRRPLDLYEQREARRVEAHEAALADILALRGIVGVATMSSDAFAARLDALDALPERDWEEFEDRAMAAIETTRDTLRTSYAAAVQREADARELEDLRQAKVAADRQAAAEARREHEQRVAAEAAAVAKEAAEAAAARRAADAAAAAQAAVEAAAARAATAERRAEEQRLAAEARVQMMQQQADARVKADAARRQEQLKAFAERAEADRQDAIAAAREKWQADVVATREATAARAKDLVHRRQVIAQAEAAMVAALIEAMHAEEDPAVDDPATHQDLTLVASMVIDAIVEGTIPHVAVTF